MGLFRKKKKSILDLLKIEINAIQNLPFEKLAESEEDSSDKFVDYYIKLQKYEFDVFDHLTLKIFHEDFIINKETGINAFFEVKENELVIEKVKNVVNSLVSYFGNDSTGSGKWNPNDEYMMDNDYWTGRHWFVNKDGKLIKDFQEGSYNIRVNYDNEEGFQLSILSFNNLIE